MNPVLALKENPFVLAPMAGITDHAFRSFMRARGASVVITELVSATGLDFESEKTRQLMSYDESQRPYGVQLFGEDPEILARSAKKVEEIGADFVDLNFGCPVPKVVKKGAGSAMLKDLPQMSKVLRAIKSAVTLPVTIKIRTGWDAGTRNASDVCQLAFDEGISWVAIHGRTRAQGYEGLADWNYIAEVKATAPLPVLGNGDLLTGKQAVEFWKRSGCDGVLIGRGCLRNPFIFQDAMKEMRGEKTPAGPREGLDIAKTFLDLCTLLNRHCPPRLVPIQMRKFAAWYSTGYAGSSLFRKRLFETKDEAALLPLIVEYFKGLSEISSERNLESQFLMGGHG